MRLRTLREAVETAAALGCPVALGQSHAPGIYLPLAEAQAVAALVEHARKLAGRAAALEYRASQAALRAAFALAMTQQEPLPGQTPLFVDILLRREHLHQRDADNEAKALLDAMNGIVYPDDRWIDDLHIWRAVGEPEIIVEAGIL